MKKPSLILAVVLPVLVIAIFTARAANDRRVLQLPTSKNLTLPVPGYVARTNGFPATIAVSPDGRYAALLNQGYGTQETVGRQSIAILDLRNNQLHDFPDDRLGNNARQSYFIGLAFSSDGKHLYASMGSITDPTGEKPTSTGNGIAVYKFADGQVTPERFIKMPPQKLAEGKEAAYGLRTTPAGTAIPYPAGFAVLNGPKGDRLLVANNLSDNVVLLDVTTGTILQSFDVSRNRYVPAAYPYTIIANKAGTKAWVSLWNASTVAELNLGTGKVAAWHDVFGSTDATAPSSHPTAMAPNPAEDKLYVALSNKDVDFVVTLDLKKGQIERRFHVNLETSLKSAPGSVPESLALSMDGERLFVGCASLDVVAVFDTRKSGPEVAPIGFIPTEWYPSALAIVGNDLLIATAKGEGSGPNNMKATVQIGPYHRAQPYIATLMGGSIARVSLADIEKNLAAYTRQVEDDNLLFTDPGKFEFAGGKNPIRHVIYILKENRTYDQIFGDLPVGDGDPSLTMYGADITPNEHKLALQFGVLDNFYDSGEVSGDGHLWSTAATTSDYNEKTWPIAYRGKERTYDFGGAVADDLALEKGIPDVDDPGTGFLWDSLSRQGATYRIYGEFVEAVWCKNEKADTPMQGTPSAASAACPNAAVRNGDPLPATVGNPRGGPSPWPWPVPLFKEVRPEKAALRGHYDPNFPDFNTDYPDQLRADEFLRELDEFVKARGTPKELPQFALLYLPDDHTGGTRPAKPTPQASVADNDLAVGRVVDAVSHSPYWEDTAIFVVEDDAQNGADHLDAHRSTALVISKYSPRPEKPFVDHHFYTTVSMIHTMENLLDLQPMNLFDAHAPLMTPLFNGPGTQPPYTADDKSLQSGLIYRVNEKRAAGAKESLKMDFSRPDAADAKKLNAILWRNAKGDASNPAAPPSPAEPSN
ncbi:MAG: phosphoesterase [Terriglobales bacterium]